MLSISKCLEYRLTDGGEISVLYYVTGLQTRQMVLLCSSSGRLRNEGSSLFSTLITVSGTTKSKTKQTPWLLVRERTIPTERPLLVDEI
jgi:hypothetical protein